jgi:hypothetical protein
MKKRKIFSLSRKKRTLLTFLLSFLNSKGIEAGSGFETCFDISSPNTFIRGKLVYQELVSTFSSQNISKMGDDQNLSICCNFEGNYDYSIFYYNSSCDLEIPKNCSFSDENNRIFKQIFYCNKIAGDVFCVDDKNKCGGAAFDDYTRSLFECDSGAMCSNDDLKLTKFITNKTIIGNCSTTYHDIENYFQNNTGQLIANKK